MSWKELLKSSEFKWWNIFIRDLFLAVVIFIVHYQTKFQSTMVWFITGMLLVWISWHFSDYVKLMRLENAV